MSMTKRVVLVPTYNEREAVDAFLSRMIPLARSASFDILFLDDASPDGTGEYLENISQNEPHIKVFHGPPKRGLARAYLDGFQIAMNSGYTHILQMDVDLSHPPDVVPYMFELLKTHDVAIGSRYVKDGGTENWPWYRQVISRGGSLYARTLLGVPISDLTGGFNAWRHDVLKVILEPPPSSQGYSFQVELKYRAYRAGFRIVEHPIVFVERQQGQSKMSSRIVAEAAMRVLQWRFKRPWDKSIS